jgi:nucleoside-diphosphate-sugar epimerase
MKSLVLGGSVFVGRHLVDALLRDGHDVAVLNRGRTAADLPAEVERIVADRTDRQQMHDALAGRTWDAVFDVSGFVMAAGGSDIEGLLDLLDGNVGRYVFVSSVMAYDQSLVGRFPWTEDMPTNSDGNATYGGFKGRVGIGDARSARGQRVPRHHCSSRGHLRAGQQHLRHGGGDVPAPLAAPARAGAARRVGGRHLRPRRRSVRGDGGTRRRALGSGQVFNVSTDSVDTNTYVRTLATVVGVDPNIVYVPDTMLPSITTPCSATSSRPATTPWSARRSWKRRSLCARRYPLLDGHAQTYEWFRAQGWNELDHPLIDPVWKASWDFTAEAELADRIANA